MKDADAAFLRDSQLPIRMSSFETKLTNSAWQSHKTWAVIFKQDRAFGEGMLHGTARRIGAKIVEVPGSHAGFITHPREVADVIDEAARQSSASVAK